METILVIGASGQLGTATTRRLVAKNNPVRALCRNSESAERFRSIGVEAVMGDLTDSASLQRACNGVSVIIATANASIPTRPTDTFKAVDSVGYQNLIHAARESRVRRFVYVSAPLSKYTHLSPLLKAKREIEQLLTSSTLDCVIFRADIFMDTAFTMMGSTIPLRGSEAATMLRPFRFANRYFAKIKDSIEQKGVALIPGDGTKRHGFICVDDMAGLLASAAISGPLGIHIAGGPNALTFMDVVHLYEQILSTTLRVRRTPAPVFRAATSILRPFSPAGSNLMCLNYSAATEETLSDPTVAPAFGLNLTSAETFLRNKSAMAATA
jgi:uncharacterized protein YbjT (DUF2867 family)